jgi:hypothetical protein
MNRLPAARGEPDLDSNKSKETQAQAWICRPPFNSIQRRRSVGYALILRLVRIMSLLRLANALELSNLFMINALDSGFRNSTRKKIKIKKNRHNF